MANTANGFAAEEEGQDRLQEHPTSYEELIEKVMLPEFQVKPAETLRVKTC